MSIQREREIWDARAADSELTALRREAQFVEREAIWRWLAAELAVTAPARVLDAGCGRGATTALLAAAVQQVVGIDVSLNALAAAQRLGATAARPPSLVGASLEQLPFADAAFDAVAGRFVLHHAESLAATAAELARVLRPGGRGVFVETWGKNPLLRFGRELAELAELGLGTPDEKPLDDADLAILRRHFTVRVEFPQFTAFELLNRLFRLGVPLSRRSPWVRKWLGKAWDRAVKADRYLDAQYPAVRPWGWFVGVVLETPPPRSPE